MISATCPEIGKKLEMDDVGQPGRSCKVHYSTYNFMIFDDRVAS